MRSIRFTLYALLLLGLTSCATLPSEHLPFNQKMSWTARQKQLNHLRTWNLQGAIAIRTSEKAESAYIHWKQQNSNYTLTLFGPLGFNTTTIHGSPEKIYLKLPNGKETSANTPEELLYAQLGWALPVSNLFYWVRGIPQPTHNASKRFDQYHHLIELEQDGWKIKYLRYTGVNDRDLPSKIELDQPQLSLKLIINSWD